MTIRVEVTPGAKREQVIQTPGGTLEVHVREKAREGAANTRVRELLARHLKVPVAHLRLVRGHRSRRKYYTLVR